MSSPSEEKAPPVLIDVVSDVMCPWCYIGQRHLEKALDIAGETETLVNWRPFQLDATLPAEGKDRMLYLTEKFGGKERAKAIYGQIDEAGKAVGIDFQFDRITLSPNTLDAHRVIRWAGEAGAARQAAVVRKLFEAYFVNGLNIGDRDCLADLAAEGGMDRDDVLAKLESGADIDSVKVEIEHGQKMGVTGVPFFIFGQKYAVAGAQPPEVLANAIRQVAAELKEAADYGKA